MPSPESEPNFMYSILARVPEDDDDEPPVLGVEYSRSVALRRCAEYGGAVIEVSRLVAKDDPSYPSYKFVELLFPDPR